MTLCQGGRKAAAWSLTNGIRVKHVRNCPLGLDIGIGGKVDRAASRESWSAELGESGLEIDAVHHRG